MAMLSPAFLLVAAIQEEVHRFVITFHRKRRTGRSLRSELDGIDQLGPARIAALVKKFRTIDAIRKASREELLATPGITKPAAESVLRYFGKEESAPVSTEDRETVAKDH